MHLCAFFMLLGTIGSYVVADIDISEDRQGKADPIIAGQRNSHCMGRNNEVGTCQSRRSCSRNKGIASGQCGIASGVCCTIELKPNDETKLKRTIMRRPDDKSITDFNYTFIPVNNNICQLRVDFRTLDLAQPVLTTQMGGSGSTSSCSADYLTVAGMRLCGYSSNQHVYLPLDNIRAKSATILIHLSTSNNSANWDILATQLECSRADQQFRTNRQQEVDETVDSSDSIRTRSTAAKDAILVAPRGCLQYFPNATGTVSSFNFDSQIENQHQYLPSLNYAICFNRPNNEAMSMQFESFELSDRAGTIDTPMTDSMESTDSPAQEVADDTVDSLCAWMGVQPESAILQDYLMIPRAIYSKRPPSIATFFCGKVLDQVTITDYNQPGPFVMHFFSDNFVDATQNVEKGFRFTYRMTATD